MCGVGLHAHHQNDSPLRARRTVRRMTVGLPHTHLTRTQNPMVRGNCLSGRLAPGLAFTPEPPTEAA